jgi:putative tryptophan/tyrosine transport system substrate-binding protein
VIGFFYAGSPVEYLVTQFRHGLAESGYIEGHNVAIQFRWADNQTARLPELAANLVRRQVSVIVAAPTPAALAVKAATTTIPIVFAAGGDPVRDGLVASLNRPGGNATGISYLTVALGEKRLGLLHELMPTATRVAVLMNRNSPVSVIGFKDIQAAALVIGLQTEVFPASTNQEIDAAFAALIQKPIDILLVVPDPLFTTRRVQLVTLAARHRVPALYPSRAFSDIGGLMSYGTDVSEVYHQLGLYAGRILKGENPADMPVEQPTKYDFVINLQTARTLGIDIPPTLLARADEVIE